MKRITANIILAMVVVLLLSAAGYSQQVILKVDVPFEFNVGQKAFPAGEYRVARVAPHTLALRDSKDQFLTSVVTGPVMSLTTLPTPKLKFEFEQGRYVLSQIWPAWVATGYQLPVQKQFSAIAQNQPAGTNLQNLGTGSPGK